MYVRGVLETCLCASDLAAAERFYHEVIGLPVYAAQPGRHVFFRCGPGMLLIFDPTATREPTELHGAILPGHGTTGVGHVAFHISATDFDAWRARLAAHGVALESEIAWPAGGRSLYFRDPANNCVELATPALWGLPEQA